MPPFYGLGSAGMEERNGRYVARPLETVKGVGVWKSESADRRKTRESADRSETRESADRRMRCIKRWIMVLFFFFFLLGTGLSVARCWWCYRADFGFLLLSLLCLGRQLVKINHDLLRLGFFIVKFLMLGAASGDTD